MSTKREIVVFKELRKRCVMPDLFHGWTSDKTHSVIKRVFSKDGIWLSENVLNPRFRSYIKPLRRKRHWSFGYCYDIVEVAKIIFDSMGVECQPFVSKTKKTGNERLDKHHVLKIGEYAFDPAEGGKQPWKSYNHYRKCHNMPQRPSERALALYVRILDFCCSAGLFTLQQKTTVLRFKSELPAIERRLRQARG